MDPLKVKAARVFAQDNILNTISKTITERMRERTPLSDMEHKFLKAVYNPDKRMR